MRKKIVAGNWKMNHDLSETEEFCIDLKMQVFPEDVAIMIAPAFTNLHHTFKSFRDYPVEVIAQNMSEHEEGAYTGEVSAKMIKSVGITTVIIGHSERRTLFNETDEVLAKKVNAAQKHEMTSIFCIGESLEDRKAGKHFEIIDSQLEHGLFHLQSNQFENIIIAYEPVWAIGTGETATPEQAQEMHAHIREAISEKYGEQVGKKIRILYGGSVKPENAREILTQPDVDGALVGGASLKAESLMKISSAASETYL